MSDGLLRFVAPVELQAADGEGKTPTVSILAYAGGIMNIPGWGRVIVDLKGLDAGGQVPLLIDHDPTLQGIVGHGSAFVSSGELRVTGKVPLVNDAARQVVERAKAGFKWQASVGVQPTKHERLEAGATAAVNGKSFRADGMGITLVRTGVLKEVSILALGADDQTSVAIAASLKGSSMSESTTTNIIPDDLQFSWDRPGLSESERIEARLSAFRREYGDVLPDFGHGMVRAASSGSLSWADAEREILRAEVRALHLQKLRGERPAPPPIHGSSRDVSQEVMQAAFCRSAGLQDLDKHFKPEICEAADRMPGLGLGELLLTAAGEGGYTGRPAITQSNLREVLRAAFSVHTLTTMLTSTGNKILLDGFNAIPQSWREVAQVRPVNNFKETTAFRLTTDLEYEELGPGGEIKHGTAGQESYAVTAKTYAKMLALTRQDIINDDLSAFADLRNRLGMGAAIALNKAFWTAWLAAYDGAAFWTGARANLVTSAALGEAGLNLAVAAFRKLAAPDGNMMSLQPKFVLCPPELESTALKLYSSQEVRDTTASTMTQTANIFWNRFKPVIVPELSNSAFTGYSATTWWLLADPKILASALVVFLNGQESPTIESAETDFNTLGIQFRGYHDFGMTMSEYRASVAAEA